ncbi:OmpA family protein [Salinispira pacifica]
MAPILEIAIEEHRYVPFEVPESGETVVVHLTTLEPGQRRAIIEVFRSWGAERREAARFDLQELPRGARRPRIDLEAARSGGVVLLRVLVDGRDAGTRRIRLYRNRAALLTVAVLLLVLILTAGILLLLRPWRPAPSSSSGTAQGRAAEAAAPPPQTPPAESTPQEAQGGAAEPSTGAPAAASTAPLHRSWTIYFRPDDISLTAEATAALAPVVQALEDARVTELSIIGHCAPAGTEAGRVSISVGRAAAVADYLRSHGVDIPADANVEGVGAADPVTTDPERQDLNRRAVITVTYRP